MRLKHQINLKKLSKGPNSHNSKIEGLNWAKVSKID